MRMYLLLAALVLLVVFSLREHFEATASIKAPPYDDTEKLRILDMLRNSDQATLLTQAEAANPSLKKAQTDAEAAYATAPTDAKKTAVDAAKKALKVKSAELITAEVEKFFTTKYKPATVPITKEDVAAYVGALPIDTLNKPMIETVLKSYFVGQSGVGTSVSSGYADVLRGLGQGFGYGMTATGTPASAPGGAPGASASGPSVDVDYRGAGGGGMPSTGATPTGAVREEYDYADRICPQGTTMDIVRGEYTCQYPATDFTCPSGFFSSNGMCKSNSGGFAEPQCPAGKQLNPARKCAAPSVPAPCPSGYEPSWTSCRRPRGATGSATTSTPPTSSPPGSAMTSSAAAAPGNTTGGTSASSYGPTAGGGASKYMVWGPVGGGRAEGDGGVSPMDSSKTNKYPELLGGLGKGGDKTRIDGIGLTEPSSSWQLSMSGMLPDAKSLGVNEMSKYLPFSRAPGDMEKIPDPYRVNQTFRQSSYSSKTEPVPFLADFSAFQK